MNRKADYRKIADYYDKGRTLSESNIDLWMDIISRMSGANPGSKVLDLGCGTGRFSIPMAERLGYRVTGADASPEMLRKAREKVTGGLATWDIQDAHHLLYADGSFDLVFMSLVLHHCEDPARVVKECLRVLAPGGMFLLRHVVYDEIRDDPEYTFFPEARIIDEARLLPAATITGFMEEAGFKDIVTESIIQKSSVNGADLLRKFSGKSVSTLSMIPEESFNRGIQQLKTYVAQHPDDPWLLQDRLRITAARKPV